MIVAYCGDRAITALVDFPRDGVHDSYRRAVVGPRAQALNFETTVHAHAALRLLPPEEDASTWLVGYEAELLARGDAAPRLFTMEPDDAADR